MIDNRTAPYGLFALRTALGIMFIAHAYLKFAIFTVPGFEAFLAQVGMPTALAWPIILAEFVGGVAILIGVQARLRERLVLGACIRLVGPRRRARWLASAGEREPHQPQAVPRQQPHIGGRAHRSSILFTRGGSDLM